MGAFVMKRPEQRLQIAVVRGLRAVLPYDWIVHHSPNGGLRTKAEGALFRAMGTEPGYPDIEVLGCDEFGPRSWFLEMKAPGGSLTEAQKTMHERLRSLGFDVAVVRSWDEVVMACRQWRLPLRIVELA